MQVENPEDIVSQGDKKKILPYLITPIIILLAISFYLWGPSIQEIKNFLSMGPTRTFLTDKNTEIANKSKKVVYKDEICNNLPNDYRIFTWAEKNPDIKINTFVGCDDEAKQEGLKGVVALPADEGMLFVFEKPDLYKFWMKDTSIYISVAFLNDKQEIIGIFDPEPLTETTFGPEKIKSKYVLEVTKGWFEHNNVKPGDKIIFSKKENVQKNEIQAPNVQQQEENKETNNNPAETAKQ